MNKTEMIATVADSTGHPKNVVKTILEDILDTIGSEVGSGEDVGFLGFGKFICHKQAKRKCHNPQTGKKIKVPAKQVIKFRPSSVLKELVK